MFFIEVLCSKASIYVRVYDYRIYNRRSVEFSEWKYSNLLKQLVVLLYKTKHKIIAYFFNIEVLCIKATIYAGVYDYRISTEVWKI